MEKRVLYILDKFNKVGGRISLDSNLIECLGIDSIDAIKVLVEIETEFGIVFSENDLGLEAFESVNHLCKLICKYMKEECL